MEDDVYKPILLGGEAEAKQLISEKPYITERDAFSMQLKELFVIQNPTLASHEKEEVFASEDFKQFIASKRELCSLFYYPWNQTIVKCCEADDYFKLKTNRNQDLITAAEQKKLYNSKAAVFGLSVGSNIAFTLTQAVISREITIADLDKLDTTNLNRILAGVHQIGLDKTVIAARKIYEDNPYADVNALSNGVSKELLEPLLAEKKVEYIIEEIDSVKVKIDVRFLAIKYHVPVVMITDNGDGVVLHVERYDLGYDKIFEKDEAYWREKLKLPMTKEAAGGIIMNDIVGGAEKVDPKMIASVKRVLSQELVSWSQLGSAAILGGAIATVALKRIILGETKAQFVREHINIPKF